MPKNIIIDTGFWYALYDKRDEYHEFANILYDDIIIHNCLVPWPTLYETLNTRFVKRKDWLKSFKSVLSKNIVHKIFDDKYREKAYHQVFLVKKDSNMNFSFVDLIIREMLKDDELKIDAILTFNPEDFYDLCSIRKAEMIYS
ncbi:hypothetical protein QUF70_12770 [Desulfobacterales bacterium HSG17]|nr:hypothetical protein [Desulfobacterales bacterium HSG17]